MSFKRWSKLSEIGEFKRKHQHVADVTGGVVALVEGDDLVGGAVDVVGDEEQVHVLGADHAGAEQFGHDPGPPVLPVGAAGGVDQDDGHQVGLAGLDEGHGLEAFVLRAEAAGEQGDRGRLPS